MKMETLDSGIGSRSPTPDSSSSHSQINSSKVTKVATLTNHINNNSHSNSSGNGTYTNSKVKGSEKGDAPSTPTVSATAASESSGNVTKSGSVNGTSSENTSSANGHTNKQNNHTNNTSKNSKTYREYNNHNRHSSGHGQYKKYGSQSHYGYGSHNNMHSQRYNGNGHHRNYGNKHYHNNSNYHHNNYHHYNGQSYQHHHHYGQQNYHHNNHHSQNNSNGNSVKYNNSQSNSHQHPYQPNHNNSNHMNQYFNPQQQYGASHPQPQQQRITTPTTHVFLSGDTGGDPLSWTRRGGESTNNPNWSSPSLDASDTSSPAVQVGLNLPTLKQGCYSPSPQNSSPALSPSTTSTTDSIDVCSIQDEAGTATSNTNISTSGEGGGGETTTSNNSSNNNNNSKNTRPQNSNSSKSNNSKSIEPPVHPSPRGGRLMDSSINCSIGPLQNGNNSIGVPVSGYPYNAFHQHPSAGFYAYHGTQTPHHLGGGNGRTFSHHHQKYGQNLELLMPVDASYSVENADSSISSNSSDKTLEWSDDGSYFCSCSGAGDRDDFQHISIPLSDRCLTPDFLFAPNGLLTANNKKRFYSGNNNTPVSGKLSPANHNQRFHHYHHPRKMMYQPHGFPREFFDDLYPEDYVRAFSEFGEVKDRPKGLAQSPQNDSLSEGIWLKFLANQQTTETFRKKMELWRDVYRIVRTLNYNANFKQDPRNFPTFGLQVVGSTMSGFGSNTSDVDMCLMVRETEVDQRYEAVDKLQVMYAALSATQWLDNVELIYAKVPILKFRDPKRCLEVDLNCNNFVGIRNTHLLYSYSQADWRLKPLVLVVKLWAHFHGINDAKNMTISSYSLVLMVIHFLQCGVKEPVLPVLQQTHPDLFCNTKNILQIKINDSPNNFQSNNKESIGNLLIQFLGYYATEFDYSENAVSVRTGGTIPIKQASQHKSVKNDPHQWKYLCIEEPFDRTNTARSVYDRDTFDKIVGIFHLSYKRLKASHNLESIFAPISEQDARTMSVVLR